MIPTVTFIPTKNSAETPMGDPIQIGNLEGRSVWQSVQAFAPSFRQSKVMIALIATNWLWVGLSAYIAEKVMEYLKVQRKMKDKTVGEIGVYTFIGTALIGGIGQGIAFANYTNLNKYAVIALLIVTCVVRAVELAQTADNNERLRNPKMILW
jgi:hypothetical protein